MRDFPDYYAVLGVPFDASSEEIERAYTRLQRVATPRSAGDYGTTPVVEEAYALLRHPGKRRDYDAWYASWRAQVGVESPPAARAPHAPVRHVCPRCAGTGQTKCLVCEGRADPACEGCGGRRTHTCVVCLGLGTLSDAFYREVQDELARAVRHPTEAEAGGSPAGAPARTAAAAANGRSLRTGGVVVTAALMVLALYAGRTLYRPPTPGVEVSRAPTAATPEPPSRAPAPPVVAPAPKVLSAAPSPPPRSDRRVPRVLTKGTARTTLAPGGSRSHRVSTKRPRTGTRQVRAATPGTAAASRRAPAPSAAQTPATAAPPVGPAPTVPPPAQPGAPDKQAMAAPILEMVADWADALIDGDIDSHILHYADVLERYFTKRNVTRQVVYQDKERFLSTYRTVVTYRIRNLEVLPVSADVVFAVFDKAWDFRTADKRRFAGEERQRLKLRLSGGRWRIMSEEELRVYWVVHPE